MRRLLGALLLVCVGTPALAADLDSSWLRGSSSFPADPPNYQRWSGVYGGAQLGEDFRGIDFRSGGTDMITNIAGQDGNFTGIPLTSFTQLTTMNTKGPSYGGFVGYNYQIDDVVMGFELNFSRSAVQASQTDTASRNYYVCAGAPTSSSSCASPGVLESTKFTVTNNGTATVNDYGTLRARFGWAYGNFLPYVFGGVSVSQIDTMRLVNVTYASYCTVASGSCIPIGNSSTGGITQSDLSHGKWVLGFDAGLGIDYALTRNVFLRFEAEYLQLGSTNDIKVSDATARVGAGLKF